MSICFPGGREKEEEKGRWWEGEGGRMIGTGNTLSQLLFHVDLLLQLQYT